MITTIRYGVKIWDYKGKDKHDWCDWPPFSYGKESSEDINQAYKVFNGVEGNRRYKFSVEEYEGEFK